MSITSLFDGSFGTSHPAPRDLRCYFMLRAEGSVGQKCAVKKIE